MHFFRSSGSDVSATKMALLPLHKWPKFFLLIFIIIFCYQSGVVYGARTRSHTNGKQALKYLKGIGVGLGTRSTNENVGLWPSVFNLATKAVITANATCGEMGREEFCRLVENGKGRCGICDALSHDSSKKHPIQNAIDGSNRWWQSPALSRGPQYEYITIELDLKQVYQVAYVIVKAANSPRPGSWILERSLDGENYFPWQYFATSDKECLEKYGVPARKGKPYYLTDSEVICTSFYSRLPPLDHGEIHTSLIHGRPGANETSPELLEFTKARYVRLRLQGLRGTVEPLPRWLAQDSSRDKRLFYSIKDISVVGQCVCNGHASSCRHNVASGHPECECSHHTCGPNCEKCCPLYNQKLWGPGSARDARHCLPCNCHGHATSCHYDEDVDRNGLSLDINGSYQGGGVCDNCTAFTSGINCEKCMDGFYRPVGVRADDETPCVKCDCDPLGSLGTCNEHGKCNCKLGFAGEKCTECAEGYRGFPNCEKCPCDFRGVVEYNDCDQGCICKENVDGKFCDRCKVGTFSLQKDNPDGCYACYCSGITTLCEAAILQTKTIEHNEDWLISDITATETSKPFLDPESQLYMVGNYELPNIESYFWLAPSQYLGNKLEIYGSKLVFKVHWVVMRGDTSGKPTTGPNVILVGNNNLKIALGDEQIIGNNMTFTIDLIEKNWYHVNKDVKDIVTRHRRTEYKGDIVTRNQFLSVLSDLKHILLRAKFHTDQIEGAFESAVINIGEEESTEWISRVEKCSCPSGYTGLSCESCDYGHARITTNVSSHLSQNFCVKCDCNGHSRTCNVETGECSCEHNTIGETCERCAPGYYGNPLAGTPDDCKKCACPLIEEENNFSPSCQLDSFSLSNGEDEAGYVCTQCPKGYTGDHCEICDDGYYGNPLKLGSTCQPCSCGGSPCDRMTGQCLSCKGNTEGWKCDRCKSGYFGDALASNCQACLCDPIGSKSQECDVQTGQCDCKDKFTGRTCDRCETGYGNVTALCKPCDCNLIGSKSDICDPQSGLCDCQPGVEGFHCDACQHLHYGFSETGCQSCNCKKSGSEFSTCHIRTGECRCKKHYVGRDCSECEVGYWESEKGCVPCSCDEKGTVDSTKKCDAYGQCPCKAGVGGLRCDKCLTGYYDFSINGCRACGSCLKGQICDPIGGCICPSGTYGSECSKCLANYYGHEPEKGCRPCNCNHEGSLYMQCHAQTGQCMCKQGYKGVHCDQCEHGYYLSGTKCRRCSCNVAGTDKEKGNCTKDGICQCRPDGTCPCKRNVVGKHCNECKESAFGLDSSNPNGCTECFCFGRSTKCSEASLTWGQFRTNSSRTATFEFSSSYPKLSHNLIPGTYGNVTIKSSPLQHPLYWKLHPVFRGDRILSYGGYLRFSIETIDQDKSQNFTKRKPLVILQGNGIDLEHYPILPPVNNKYEVRLHESLWRNAERRKNTIPRLELMIVLQNLTDIFIKTTDASRYKKLILHEVTLDTAIEVPGSPPPHAVGVEICDCPREYNSTSCQDPSIGFFRSHNKKEVVKGEIIIDDIIGKARKCECKGRSDVCDTETGHCLNCKNNTTGIFCERCAEGYYDGNPQKKGEQCLPCPCPSASKNFARSCTQHMRTGKFICECKKGYTGEKCDKCDKGYYGQPHTPNGKCIPCNCNKQGSISNECDSEGKCRCKPGVLGKQCSQCSEPRSILQNNQCTPCDNCIQWLLDDLEEMSKHLYDNTSHLADGSLHPPWEYLNEININYQDLKIKYENFEKTANETKDFIKNANIEEIENKANYWNRNLNATTNDVKNLLAKASEVYANAELLLNDAKIAEEEIVTAIVDLNDFGQKHIDVENAVKQGRKYLQEIKHLNKTLMNIDNHKNTLDNCKKVADVLNSFTEPSIDPNELRKKLDDIYRRLKDIEKLLLEIHDKTQLVNQKNISNKILYDKVVSLIKDVQKKLQEIEELDKVNSKIEETYKLMNDVERIHDEIDELDIEAKLDELRETNDILTMDRNKLIGLVELTRKHAKDLEDKAREYKQLFNLTNKELDAVKASEAYGKIVSLIDSAYKNAQEALEEVDKTKQLIQPMKKDSIYDNSSILFANSTRLEARVKVQIEKINEAKKKAIDLKNKVYSNNNMIWNNGIANSNHSKVIDEIKNKLNNNYLEEVQKKISHANHISNEVQEVYKDAKNIDVNVKIDLAKKLKKYLNLTSDANISAIKLQVQNTQDLLDDILSANSSHMEIIQQFNKNNKDFVLKNNTVAAKLAELKARIKSSRDTLDGLKVALSGSDCYRSYKTYSSDSSRLTKIQMSFIYNNPEANNEKKALFHLGNQQQYMSLYTLNNNLHFKMLLGKNITNIQHDGLKLNQLYTVLIERIGQTVTVTLDDKPKRAFIDKKDNEIFLMDESKLYVGLLPTDEVEGLPGCIQNLYLNGNNVGLWNFETSRGTCTGCKHNVTVANSLTNHRFNGEGYMTFEKKIQSDTLTHNVVLSMTIATFDEDALIFLAADNENFMALTLKEGRLQYEIHYKQADPIILTSEKKYNTGKPVDIQTTLAYKKPHDMGTLAIGTNKDELLSDKREIKNSDQLQIRNCDFLFGGISPQYSILQNSSKLKLHTRVSYLGDISNIEASSKRGSRSYSLESSDHFGVELQGGQLEFTKVSFNEEGYLKLALDNVNKIESISFLIKTDKGKSFIMKFESEDIIFYIEDDQLNVKLSTQDINLTSTKKITNNYDFTLVDFLIDDNEVKLLINGEEADTKLGVDWERNIENNKLDIIIGNDFQTNSQWFYGELKELFINKELVKFNSLNIVDFKKAKIGRSLSLENRERPLTKMMPTIGSLPISMKEMQNTEGCDKHINYQYDRNAIKFGDSPGSHVVQFFKEQLWRQDYTIEIKFRTFYRNGVIFLTKGPKNHFTMLEVYDGRIRLQINGKRKKEFVLPQFIDDGQWHRVLLQQTVVKKKRKLIISVDGIADKPKKVPQNKLSREFYVGGIPVTFKPIKDLDVHPFRGCIKYLKINNVTQPLLQENNHYNVGQCFPTVERGSYFSGNSYAVYDHNFRVTNYLELNFEFRTSELNGILLSISNPDNSPAISVELQNGAVVMTVDMGNGYVSNVTNYLSDYALCNNRWHNVSAWLSSELTVNVDGVSKSWVLADFDSRINELEGPLYLGGIPENAPTGTLKVQENFKGCIKNIKIGNQLKDWVDMHELNNVSLNSCPIA